MARDGARIIGGHTIGGFFWECTGFGPLVRPSAREGAYSLGEDSNRVQGMVLGCAGYRGGRKHRGMSDKTSGLGGLRDIRPQASPDARRALTLHTR